MHGILLFVQEYLKDAKRPCEVIMAHDNCACSQGGREREREGERGGGRGRERERGEGGGKGGERERGGEGGERKGGRVRESVCGGGGVRGRYGESIRKSEEELHAVFSSLFLFSDIH